MKIGYAGVIEGRKDLATGRVTGQVREAKNALKVSPLSLPSLCFLYPYLFVR